MKKKKYSIWFYAILIAIPFLAVLLLEGTLRLFNYGDDFSTFVQIEEISPGQYFLNPDLTKKYFSNTTAVPSVLPDPFDKIKSDNTIRIFVFGGSTTAGYPYSANASFPRQIKRKLELMYPQNKIEVINLGVSAVNSYFVNDILPYVIDQKPDLLIFYTGHNEYYGALGPASSEFIGSNPSVVKTILFLRELKIYHLVSDFIETILGIFSDDQSQSRGTLMKEMIEEQKIPLNSELYKEGLNQYRENLEDILSYCNQKEVPTIVGNLVSNLKQKPLQRDEGKAFEYFERAQKYLQENDTVNAKIEFTKAKDADELRFRAPSKFDEILNELNANLSFEFVDIKTGFEEKSQNSIVGYDLMIDHLHPNLEGYRIMSELFYEKVDAYLVEKFMKAENLNENAIDNYLSENFPFTRYDSTLANINIKVLLNDFPFKSEKSFDLQNYDLKNYADTLAMLSIREGTGWAASHLKLFEYYYSKKQFDKAAKELFTLMEARPFYKSALYESIPKLFSVGEIREAKHILVRNHRRYPDGFTAKQLGMINLQEGNVKLANNLLKEAATFSPNDPEVFFNLSKSYFALQDLRNAKRSMEKCLSLAPEYPGAKSIYKRLQDIEDEDIK